MSNQQIGVVLMVLPLLWLAYRILAATKGRVTADIIQIIAAITMFVAGRLTAGKSLFSIFIN